MNLANEFSVKEERVHKMLSRMGYDSLLLTTRENFSWLSCGGRAVVSNIVHSSPVYLLVTPNKKFAIGLNMDLPRTYDEELDNLGFEPVSLPTFGKTPLEAARELAVGRLAADDMLPGLDNIGHEILSLHEPYTPEEADRYKKVAAECADIIYELANWVEPGMTERHVLAHMWGLYLEHDFDGDCMFIVSDDRIKKYRHAIPGYKKIEKVVLLAPAVFKKGLHVQISRMVSFGDPPEETRRRQMDMINLQASMVAAANPGVGLNSLLKQCFDSFDKMGYPEEKTNHVHGGPCGYRVSYSERCQNLEEVVKPNMAFSWYLTVTGAKTEETSFVNENRCELISVSKDWPLIDVVKGDRKISMPDLLIK